MGQVNIANNTYSNKIRKKHRREQKIRRIKHALYCIIGIAALCFGIILWGRNTLLRGQGQLSWFGENTSQKRVETLKLESKNYPEALQNMLERNEETAEFVSQYPNRAQYQENEIDISKEIETDKVPLFLQWDLRWGYHNYGDEFIGVAGCGPVCMSMASVFLTGNTDENPSEMAKFAYEQGYYTQEGTSWSFFTEGAGKLGLQGKELGLSETEIKQVLDQSGVVICSMRPGDFTTTGHFVLLRGYDEKGFYVNDPNSEKNSEKQWSYQTLSSQIKCLWGISQ